MLKLEPNRLICLKTNYINIGRFGEKSSRGAKTSVLILIKAISVHFGHLESGTVRRWNCWAVERWNGGKVQKDNEAAAVFIGKSRLKVVLPMLWYRSRKVRQSRNSNPDFLKPQSAQRTQRVKYFISKHLCYLSPFWCFLYKLQGVIFGYLHKLLRNR